MAENRIFVSAKFFKYIGPGETDGNSCYSCLNCSVALKKKDGSPMDYGCSDSSRNNLRKHMKVMNACFYRSQQYF